MTESRRPPAPTADEIEARFDSAFYRVCRPLFWNCIHFGMHVILRARYDSRGIDQIKDAEGPYIFASNHNSHVDTGAILGTLPGAVRKRTVVAAALDVFSPADQRGIRAIPKHVLQFTVGIAFQAFAFDRQGPPLRSIRTSRQLLGNGWSMLLYPEGTRGKPGVMQPFKHGVALLAKFTKKPVIPIFVEGGHRVLPMNATVPRPGVVRVFYGEPMYPERGEAPDMFTNRVREAVKALEPSGETIKTELVSPPEVAPDIDPISPQPATDGP